jgi:HEAT repeat protein
VIDQAEIHRKANSSRLEERNEAAKSFRVRADFFQVPDKVQAWQDLHRLTKDEDSNVRWNAAIALRSVFSYLADKDQAWQDLHRLTQDIESSVRTKAAEALGEAFGMIPDKDQAWQDLHRLTQDEDSKVRERTADALGSAFSQVPDKNLAWQDLVNLTQDKDSDVQMGTIIALKTAFSLVPDKDRAWQDLHKLIHFGYTYHGWQAGDVLGSAFNQVPNKYQAWQDLHRFTQDTEGSIRTNAAEALGEAFGMIPDKDQAWQDLHRLTQDIEDSVRTNAAKALGKVFGMIPDRDQAWQDLHRLTQDGEGSVRENATEALGKAFGVVPDRDLAWQDLHRLAQDIQNENLGMRRLEVLRALETAFSHVPYKYQAFRDILSLNKNEDTIELLIVERAQKTFRTFLLQEEGIQSTINEIQKEAKQIYQVTRGTGTKYEGPSAKIHQAAERLSLDDLVEVCKQTDEIISTLKQLYNVLPKEMRQSANEDLKSIETNELRYSLSIINKLLRDAFPYIKLALNIDANLERVTKNIIDSNAALHHETYAAIVESLNKNDKEIVSKVLDAIKNGNITQELANEKFADEIVKTTNELISEIKAEKLKIEDFEVKNLDFWKEVVKSQSIENKIILTIPIIPFLLTYEASCKLKDGKLRSLWNQIIAKVKDTRTSPSFSSSARCP